MEWWPYRCYSAQCWGISLEDHLSSPCTGGEWWIVVIIGACSLLWSIWGLLSKTDYILATGRRVCYLKSHTLKILLIEEWDRSALPSQMKYHVVVGYSCGSQSLCWAECKHLLCSEESPGQLQSFLFVEQRITLVVFTQLPVGPLDYSHH